MNSYVLKKSKKNDIIARISHFVMLAAVSVSHAGIDGFCLKFRNHKHEYVSVSNVDI